MTMQHCSIYLMMRLLNILYGDDDDDDGDDGNIDRPVVINVKLCHLVCEVMIHCCDVEHLLSSNESC